MMNLYTYGRGTPVDGVIAVDQQFVAMLVGAVGSVPLEQYDLLVTGDNAIQSMRSAWEGQPEQSDVGWVYTRKEFIGLLAAALRTKIESQPGDLNWPVFIKAMFAAVQEKHLQIYVRDPTVAAILNDVNFDGRIENPAGQDFLMVVDTNMGYNKASALMNTALAYQVALNAEGSGTADLTIRQQHGGQGGEPPVCVQGVGGYSGDISYESMIRRCYWSYVRVYAPTGSQLLAASGHTAPAEAFSHGRAWNGTATAITDTTGLMLFDNFVLVPFGQAADVLFQYQLPPAITQTQPDGSKLYVLEVMKQAGSRPRAVTVTLTLPPGHTLVSAQPLPQQNEGNTLTFSLNLTTDLRLIVNYR